jgi:predicted tellurium resistance membrane protein TerC
MSSDALGDIDFSLTDGDFDAWKFSPPPDFSALLQVIAIDLVLAGDNAIVIGLAAAGLPAEQRKKAILVGIAAATVLRIIFALITQQLLQIGPILLVAGGLLLLYVCWKMWRELSTTHEEEEDATEALSDSDYNADGKGRGRQDQDRLRRLPGRSLSPTFRCHWITCWRSPARRWITRRCLSSAWRCRLR